jgi:NADPH:quinone reductase-like Zn-dependent oxidoreductase
VKAIEFSSYGTPETVEVVEAKPPHAGPSEVRISVRASGISSGEVRLRSGELRDVFPVEFPYRSGFDAAGTVDEIGEEVVDVTLGDEVFGWVSPISRGANADFAVLTAWALKPAVWSWAEAGGAAGGVETAARVLDLLNVRSDDTLLIQGAAGATGSIIVQFAIARGATVIGTASLHNHEFLRSLGALPTNYGRGLVERVRALAPTGVDAVIDCAGGSLPDLIVIAGDAARVVTIADTRSADYGVHMSVGGADRLALHGLSTALELAVADRLVIPIAAEVPFANAAGAHAIAEAKHPPGKIILIH